MIRLRTAHIVDTRVEVTLYARAHDINTKKTNATAPHSRCSSVHTWKLCTVFSTRMF